MKKIGIIGFGSFTREIIPRIKKPFDIFVSSDYLEKISNLHDIEKNYNCKIYSLEKYSVDKYKALVTLTNSEQRKLIIESMPINTEYYTFIDKKACILDKNINIGKGSIICAGSVLTTNINLGKFSQINLNTTIGHDCIIGDYFTTAPGVNISGNCKIGNHVYFGTNSSIKEKITVSDNVIFGLNAGITKNINDCGVYIGTPVKKI